FGPGPHRARVHIIRKGGPIVATISGWRPAGDAVSLREAMDRLLEQSVLRPRQAGNGAQGAPQDWRMPPDVSETAQECTIRACAPAVATASVLSGAAGPRGCPRFSVRIAPPWVAHYSEAAQVGACAPP